MKKYIDPDGGAMFFSSGKKKGGYSQKMFSAMAAELGADIVSGAIGTTRNSIIQKLMDSGINVYDRYPLYAQRQ